MGELSAQNGMEDWMSEYPGTESSFNTRWYVAQLRPNQQHIATRNLMRQGFEAFMPEIIRDVKTVRGFVQKKRSLFPGYLFVAVQSGEARWYNISSTRGVCRLVSFGGRLPAPVPADLIASLRERTDPDGLLMPEPRLERGQSVLVTRGPFSDFLATVERNEDDARVWLLLDLLGQQTRVELPRDHVSLHSLKSA